MASGVLQNFLFWTFEYTMSYGGQVPLERGLEYLRDNFVFVMEKNQPVWIVAALGIPALFFSGFNMKRLFSILVLLLFLICSFLTTVPGFYFRPHYFITLLPAASMLAAILIGFLVQLKIPAAKPFVTKTIAFAVLGIVLGIGIHANSHYLFHEKPNDISRRIYGLNPFVESEAIGNFIKSHTNEGDKILVLGSEPQIYFHAERQSATGFIYMYPMMEKHEFNLQMQEQMIEEVKAADPEVIVYVDIRVSWLRKSYSPRRIFAWMMETETGGDYELIGTVEVFSDTTLYKFTDVAMKNQPESKFRVRIFKKK